MDGISVEFSYSPCSLGKEHRTRGNTDGSAGGAYRHNTPLPTAQKSKVIGILNGFQIVISCSGVASENV